MKKLMTYALSLILLLIAAGGVVYAFFPQTMLDITYTQYSSAANLEAKTIDIKGYKVHYFASKTPDKAETMVLVHGMGDDKNSFLQTAAKLSEHFNLILPDLLGHGENKRDPNLNYSIDKQSDFLKNLVIELGLDRVHVVGNSMGGHSVAAFAIKFPASVNTLTLVDAAGIKIGDHVVYTGFGTTIDSDEALQVVMDRVFYQTPTIPGSVRNLMREQINNSKDFVDNTLVNDITNGAYFKLNDKVKLIQSPTLVLQGKHDQVVTRDAADYYAENIPMTTLQIIENAGHSPQLEVPDEVAQAIIEFIQGSKAKMIKSTKNTHAALTQYYRWYQLYEGELSDVRIQNQMGILSDDVLIRSAAGEMKGSANYPGRLAVYKGWKNAHHVQDVNVTETADGKLNLEANIIYQNIQPSGEESIYSLHYSTLLTVSKGESLPLFSELNLVPTGKLEPKPFEAAYADNRAKSLLHYWLLNMEQLDGNVEPFKELLAPSFTLDFSTAGLIESTESLEKWLQTVPTQLTSSSHYPQNFIVSAVGDNLYEMEVDLVWRGVTKDDKAVKATTHHQWLIVDDPNERFARIKTAKITQMEALSLIK